MIDEEFEELAHKCQNCKYFKIDKQDSDAFYCSYKGVKDCNFKPHKKPFEKPPEKPQLINDHIVGLPVKWQR